MKRKIKIVYLHGYLDIGGAEELKRTVVKYIDRQKYEPVVCSLSAKGEIGRLIEREGTRVVALNKTQEIWDVRAYIALYRFLRREKPDILQCSMYNAYVIGTIVGAFAGVRSIIWEEHSPGVYKKKWHIAIERLLARKAFAIVACSNYVRNYMASRERMPEGKIVTLLNCIDPERYNVAETKLEARKMLGLPEKAKIAIVVGRLYNVKGHKTLLEAWARLVKDFKGELLLLVVGEGILKNALVRQAREAGIEKSMRFLGTRTDVPLLLRASDALVLPSLYEGFGIVLLEAMTVGTPVIASKTGGIHEVVKHGWNGLLCSPGDASDFCAKLHKLLITASLQRRLAANGKTSGRQFHPQRYASELEGLYERACRSLQ